MARLFADENFPYPATEKLRAFGQDVLTIQEAGKDETALADEDVLEYASSLERAVLTLNRKDFIRLHRRSASHGGIIVCTFDLDFDALANRVRLAIKDEKELRGKLIRVKKEN